MDTLRRVNAARQARRNLLPLLSLLVFDPNGCFIHGCRTTTCPDHFTMLLRWGSYNARCWLYNQRLMGSQSGSARGPYTSSAHSSRCSHTFQSLDIYGISIARGFGRALAISAILPLLRHSKSVTSRDVSSGKTYNSLSPVRLGTDILLGCNDGFPSFGYRSDNRYCSVESCSILVCELCFLDGIVRYDLWSYGY